MPEPNTYLRTPDPPEYLRTPEPQDLVVELFSSHPASELEAGDYIEPELVAHEESANSSGVQYKNVPGIQYKNVPGGQQAANTGVQNPYNKTPGAVPSGWSRGSGASAHGVRMQARTELGQHRLSPPQGQLVTEGGTVTQDKFGRLRRVHEMDSTIKQSDLAKGVRYLKYDNDRRRYQVEISTCMTRRGQVFDTKAINKKFEGSNSSKKYDLGHARLGKNKDFHTFYLPDDWQYDSMIWVCAPNSYTGKAEFYSGLCKIDHFHHSTFQAGGAVIGAGEWIVYNGKLRKISANSGHYRPPMDVFYRSVLHMAPAFQADTIVFLYDTLLDEWVEVPIGSFISRPTGGGRYKVHPDSH